MYQFGQSVDHVPHSVSDIYLCKLWHEMCSSSLIGWLEMATNTNSSSTTTTTFTFSTCCCCCLQSTSATNCVTPYSYCSCSCSSSMLSLRMSSTLKTMGITSSSTTRKTTQSLSQCLVKHQSIDDDIGHVVDRDTQVLANTIKTVHSATIGGDKMTKPTNFAHSILNTSSSSSSYQRASTLPLNRQKHERSTTTTITPPPTPTITTLPCSTSSNRNQITSTSAVTCTTEVSTPSYTVQNLIFVVQYIYRIVYQNLIVWNRRFRRRQVN